MKTIGVIVLSYKNVFDTVECIESLKNTSLDNEYKLKIILVDNSGTKRFVSSIKKSCPYIDAIIECENNGYSAGNNEGIRLALRTGCDYITILNNDTTVDENFLNPLISELENNPNCIVAPIIYSYYTHKIWSSGGKFRRLLGDYCMLYNDFSGKRKTAFISGCCFAISSRLLQKVGLLDENYYMYCEDTDFCKRASNLNIDMFVLKDSFIYHKAGVSTKGYNEFQLYYIYRNRIYFCYTYFKGLYRLHAVLINKARALFKVIVYFLKMKKTLAKALMYAIKDGKSIVGLRRY